MSDAKIHLFLCVEESHKEELPRIIADLRAKPNVILVEVTPGHEHDIKVELLGRNVTYLKISARRHIVGTPGIRKVYCLSQ